MARRQKTATKEVMGSMMEDELWKNDRALSWASVFQGQCELFLKRLNSIPYQRSAVVFANADVKFSSPEARSRTPYRRGNGAEAMCRPQEMARMPGMLFPGRRWGVWGGRESGHRVPLIVGNQQAQTEAESVDPWGVVRYQASPCPPLRF